jgi:folate-binding protein YgfZ
MSPGNRGKYVDVSDRSLLSIEGADGLDLLQRISTNDVSKLKVGEHVQTVLTNEKGRIVDLVTVLRRAGNSILLCGHSKGGRQLKDWMDRFIVMEDAKTFLLNGEKNQFLIFDFREDGLNPYLDDFITCTVHLNHKGESTLLVVLDTHFRSRVEKAFAEYGLHSVPARDYEVYRINHAIPEHPNELSEQFNPHEVGLDYLVDYTKGCYVGQEVIARLDTYRKVQKHLRRFELSFQPQDLPAELHSERDESAGMITSCIQDPTHHGRFLALGLLNSQLLREEVASLTIENPSKNMAKLLD